MPLQGGLSIERMCQLVVVSRRSFYRSLKERQPAEEEMEVRSAIQQIALEHRRPSRNAGKPQTGGADHAGR
jgi:putative transposase